VRPYRLAEVLHFCLPTGNIPSKAARRDLDFHLSCECGTVSPVTRSRVLERTIQRISLDVPRAA